MKATTDHAPQRSAHRSAADRAFGPAEIKAGARYEAFYGLNEPPFALTADPRFFYHSAPHDQVAQRLLTAIRDREGHVVLTGDLGTGKTTLCRVVIDQLDRRTLTSFIERRVGSGDELLKRVLVDFGVMSHEESTPGRSMPSEHLGAALRSFAESLASLDASAVVVVDDADEMPPQVLDRIRVLCEASGDSKRLQVILVGQPRLTALIARSEQRAIAERVGVRAQLTPLPADEIEGYVLHRLAGAGTAPRVQFSEVALAYVHALSRGVPRVINLLCERALVRGYEHAASSIDRDLIDLAAEDLDVGLPQSAGVRIATTAAYVLAILLCLAIGAAAAAWVFHDAFGLAAGRFEPKRPTAPAARPASKP